MGALFGGGNNNQSSGSSSASSSSSASTIGVNPGPGKPIIAGGYPDDGARPMPSMNDPVATENARQLRLKLSSASGRTSTDLTGTRAYVNNFLGGSA